MPRPVGIKDVAAAAGVSTTTVSHALNGKGRIAPATRRRVEEAAERLGYRPSAMARGLAGGRTGMLAMVVSGTVDIPVQVGDFDYFLRLMNGATLAALRHGYSLTLIQSQGEPEPLDGLPLDGAIVDRERRSVAEIIESHGIEEFRRIESEVLAEVLSSGAYVVALGGGAWTIPANRELIREKKFTSIWLETNFDHCWLNIVNSKRVRPLARDRAETLRLFDERRKIYCLADWHFIIRPGSGSYDVAKQIAEEVFGIED